MKKFYKLSLIILLAILGTYAHAQHNAFFDTKGFSFQGYARNPSGGALASQNIEIRFTIYPSGNEAGAVFTETHTNVQTDPFGVFGVMVGSISTTQFRVINFGKENYFLKVETKPSASGTFATINNSALLSTPYASFANNGNPPGTIITFAGPKTNIPPGYLICDGTEHTIANYPNLAAAIGTSWGGDGSTTFRVPDLRGMFLRGFSDASDDDPNKGTRTARNGGATGNAVGSFQSGNYQSHNHGAFSNTTGSHNHVGVGVGERSGTTAVRDNTGYVTFTNTNTATGFDNTNSNNMAEFNLSGFYRHADAGDHAHTITVNDSGGPETRPKNVYVLYLIKY